MSAACLDLGLSISACTTPRQCSAAFAGLPTLPAVRPLLLPAATLAVGVAAAGLLCMFQVGSWITGAAQSLKHLEQPAPAAPAPPKPLAELIAERKVRAGPCTPPYSLQGFAGSLGAAHALLAFAAAAVGPFTESLSASQVLGVESHPIQWS
jgi:hypothetical protein